MRIKTFVLVLGLAFVITAYLLELLTFGFAYANPDKNVLVDINSKNEARLELWINILSLPIVFFTLAWIVKIVKVSEVLGL